jgi:hypothetical protein
MRRKKDKKIGLMLDDEDFYLSTTSTTSPSSSGAIDPNLQYDSWEYKTLKSKTLKSKTLNSGEKTNNRNRIYPDLKLSSEFLEVQRERKPNSSRTKRMSMEIKNSELVKLDKKKNKFGTYSSDNLSRYKLKPEARKTYPKYVEPKRSKIKRHRKEKSHSKRTKRKRKEKVDDDISNEIIIQNPLLKKPHSVSTTDSFISFQNKKISESGETIDVSNSLNSNPSEDNSLVKIFSNECVSSEEILQPGDAIQKTKLSHSTNINAFKELEFAKLNESKNTSETKNVKRTEKVKPFIELPIELEPIRKVQTDRPLTKKDSKKESKRKSYSHWLNGKKKLISSPSFLSSSSSSPREENIFIPIDSVKRPSYVSLSEIGKTSNSEKPKRPKVSFSALKRTEGFYIPKKKKLTPRERIIRQDSLEIYRNKSSSDRAKKKTKDKYKFATVKGRRRSRTLESPTISMEDGNKESWTYENRE